MKGLLVVGFVVLGVVAIPVLWIAVTTAIDRKARVRHSDNTRLRAQLREANETIASVRRKVEEIGDLNPILANAVRPLVDDYLLKNGTNSR